MWGSPPERQLPPTQAWRLATFAALSLISCEVHRIDLLARDASAPSENDNSASLGGNTSGGGTENSGGEPAATGAAGGLGGVPGKPALRVLLIVEDTQTSTDATIESWLEQTAFEGGVEVTRSPESTFADAETLDVDLIIVSPSADAGGIGGSLKQVALPILILEPAVFGAMNLGATRSSSSDSEIVISAPTHPIADGQSGSVVICADPSVIWGNVLRPGATLVAEATQNPDAGVLIAVEKGVDLGGIVPERRVGFGALKISSCQSENSRRLFEAAILWLTAK